MENDIHNQKSGTCSGFAIANGIEHLTGRYIPDKEIYKFFEDHKLSKNDGHTSLKMLSIAKAKGFAGVKITEFKKIYSPGLKIKDRDAFFQKLQKYMEDNALIMGIKSRRGHKVIELDAKNFKKPSKAPFVPGGHSVFIKKIEKKDKWILTIENSWGEDFGDKGYFYMDEYTWDDIGAIYRFKV